MSDNLNKVEEAVKNTIDYLYKIEGDCSPELYQAIAMLRQLINEEFKPAKSVSSQFIYDVISPAINNEKIAELDDLMNKYGSRGMPSYPPSWELYVDDRIATLKKGKL